MKTFLALVLDREMWYSGAIVAILFASTLLLNLVAWIALRHKVSTEGGLHDVESVGTYMICPPHSHKSFQHMVAWHRIFDIARTHSSIGVWTLSTHMIFTHGKSRTGQVVTKDANRQQLLTSIVELRREAAKYNTPATYAKCAKCQRQINAQVCAPPNAMCM